MKLPKLQKISYFCAAHIWFWAERVWCIDLLLFVQTMFCVSGWKVAKVKNWGFIWCRVFFFTAARRACMTWDWMKQKSKWISSHRSQSCRLQIGLDCLLSNHKGTVIDLCIERCSRKKLRFHIISPSCYLTLSLTHTVKCWSCYKRLNNSPRIPSPPPRQLTQTSLD